MDFLDNLTQLSPPVALAVLLWFTGKAIKKSQWQNWLIPFALPIFGAILYPFIAETASVSYSVKNPVVFNAIIGAVIGYSSTGLDQQIRQWLDRPTNPDGKTSYIARNETLPPGPPAPPAP
jgi:hypothetical protein